MLDFIKRILSHRLLSAAGAAVGATGFRDWGGRERSRRGRMALGRGAELANAGKYLAASAAFLAAIELAPESAEAYHGHGVCQHSLGNFEAARDSFRKASDRAPLRDDIRNCLGLALRKLSHLESTTECFKRALVLKPASGEALNNLADVLQARDQEVAAFVGFERALAVMPGSAGVHSNLGGAYRDAGRLGEAGESFARALALDPSHAGANFSRGTLALLQGDFATGWAGYEWRSRADGFNPSANYAASQWQGEDIAGRSIYVHSEQGLGDVLQFVRYIPALAARCDRVVLRVPEALRRTVAELASHATIISGNEPVPRCDVHSPLLSLPQAFKTDAPSIPTPGPYLHAEEGPREKWRAMLASPHALRIGLIWAAGARSSTSSRRSIDLASLAPMLADKRVRWVSLQLPPQSGDVAALPADTFLDLSALQPNMAETAAIIMELDLVITVDTSIAHLAGALGRPVWVMLPHVPDWRWQLERSDSPWYESMRLFRQAETGDWESVATALRAALDEQLGEREATV
jgi:Tfp pilus assembly protein PilF